MHHTIGTETIQAELERGMQEEGRKRYFNSVTSSIQRHEEVSTPYGQRLLSLHTTNFANAVDAFIAEAQGKRGRRHSALAFLTQIDARTSAWLALREILSNVSSHDCRLSALGIKIGRTILTEIDMRNVRATDTRLYTGILTAACKKSELSRKEATARFLYTQAGFEPCGATTQDAMLLGTKLVELAVEHLGIITCDLRYATKQGGGGGKKKHEKVYQVRATPELVDWIERGNLIFSELDPVYGPMVVPPAKWTHPLVGGYLTDAVKPLTLVKTSSRQYFARLEKQDMPLVYDAVNRIQETPWRINLHTLDLIDTILGTNSGLGGLPKRDLTPLPDRPDDIGENEAARKAYRQEALRVHEANVSHTGRRLKVASMVRTAKKYAEFQEIYFPYQLDFRGRVYPVTSLSPQGEDFVKALLEFAEGEPLGTEVAADWLAVHIANLFGVDKVSFTDRILWTHQHTDMLLACAENPYDNREWTEADKPFQAYAAAREWAGYIRNGLEHVSRIPVALDGSCSGLQNFGMALKCEVTGKAVNLLPGDKPEDIYQEVINKAHVALVKIVGEDWRSLSQEAVKYRARKAVKAIYPPSELNQPFDIWLDALQATMYDDDGKVLKRGAMEQGAYDIYWGYITAHAWLLYGVDLDTNRMSRKIAKRAVMTFPYGSKEFGFRDQLIEDIIIPANKGFEEAVKAGVCGEALYQQFPFGTCGWKAQGTMATLLWNGVNDSVVRAALAMEWLQKAARLVAKNGKRVHWNTPLGFLVEQNYVKTEEKRVETVFAGNEKVRLNLRKDTQTPDSRKSANSVAPNYVHSLDSSHLMLTVARAPDIKSWALIHDSFGTLPSRTQALFNYVRVAFVELYTAHDVLEDFRGQVLQQLPAEQIKLLPPTPTRGNLDLYSVLRSGYCFA